MATYTHRFTPATGNDPDISLFHVVERPMYGSSRLGVDAQEVDLASATPTAPTTAHPGQWRYELTDHLGNVQAVVTEELLGLDANNDQSVDQWAPVLLSAQDYEPGGSLLPGRNYNTTAYRFGAAGGQEKDDEIYGSPGTSYTAEYWQYDPRIARRWNIDPVDKPWMSPYHAFSNKFITNIDPNGANDSPIIDAATGELLGTDDQGMQGNPLFLDKKDFTQGMSHNQAAKLDKKITSLRGKEARDKFFDFFRTLDKRPDRDGFVSIDEGVDWALRHPGASDNPTPYNMLYIDASKLDFGNLSTGQFDATNTPTNVGLFTVENFAESSYNPRLRATVYALGRVQMQLTDRLTRGVTIVNDWNLPVENDRQTDYDWNFSGDVVRDSFIAGERRRTGITNAHGFRVFYYGTGTLRQ